MKHGPFERAGRDIGLPLLTIAIPTYNRSRYLARLLDSLIPQLQQEIRVEVIISDNASPDNTSAVLEEYARRGLRFLSLRNETNLGPDGNILNCFLRASGRYLWIVGDDDVLLPGSVESVLKLLYENDFDIVYVRSRDIATGTEGYLPVRASELDVEVIRDAHTFVRRTNVFLTFITANIVNRERVLSLPHEPFSQLLGTNLVQLGWMYTLVRHFRQGAYVATHLVAAGADDRGGYRLFEVFGTNLKRITEEWLVRPELVRVVLNGTVQRFFPSFVLRSRLREGAFLKEAPHALLRELFSHNYRYYLFLSPLLTLPAVPARAWLFLCRVVNRVDKALGNPMLG
jgi:abequosyltransferase